MLDDGVDLFYRGARVVGQENLLLALDPLLLLLSQVLHLLLLVEALADLLVGAGWLLSRRRLRLRLSLDLLRLPATFLRLTWLFARQRRRCAIGRVSGNAPTRLADCRGLRVL